MAMWMTARPWFFPSRGPLYSHLALPPCQPGGLGEPRQLS